MALRPRLAYPTFALGAVLVFSLSGAVSSGASVKAGGKVVSASLTKTSFTAAQAKTVKLAYKLSPKSKHFAYLLSLKKGTKWVKVRSVSKTGSFKGSHKMTVKALFGTKSVKVGRYRVKLSADANSVTRKFKVIKTEITPPPPAALQPKTGFWLGSGSDAVSTYVITFTVTSGGTNVTNFGVTINGSACAADGSIVTATSLYRVANGSFSSGRGNPSFSGSFDSATTAHGTSRVTGYEGDCGDNEYGTASWTATWHSAS
jgi:hypothetical protein